MKMNEEDHPNVNDAPQGTSVYWNGEEVAGLLWNSYSKGTGEYNATLAYFRVDETSKTLTLDRVSMRFVDGGWDSNLSNPSSYVTDRMKRAVRKFIASEKETSYWRVKI